MAVGYISPTSVEAVRPIRCQKGRVMSDATRGRPGSIRLLCIPAVALLLLAVGCSSSSGTNGIPHISAKAERSSDGMLEGLTVKGGGFSPNGQVLVNALMAASGPDTGPYVEETVQADANGKLNWVKKPVPCPQPADYGKGSYVLVTARDMTSGISGSATLNPGNAPDCSG
jgi:hypothetical protein